MSTTEIITTTQAAKLLCVCRQTLCSSDAPYFVFPGTNKRLYIKEDLLAWAQGHRPKEEGASQQKKGLDVTFQEVYRRRL